MKRLTELALAALVGLSLSATLAHAQKWDLPAGYPPANYHSQILSKFADDVRAATGGALDITVHAGASLFKVPEIKRAVQTGQAQIGELLMGALENEDAVFGADNLPFLASNLDEAKKLAESSRPFIEKRLAALGMRLLYWTPWPPQGFYSPKPLKTGEDLKGLKFRSYGPSAARLAELSGMQVTTVQAAEISQAFATGRVNAMISSAATGYDSKLWEHVKYFYDVQAWIPKNMVIVNEKAYAALDDKKRDALLQAASAAQTHGWAESERLTKFYLDELRKNGMNIVLPSPELHSFLKGIGADLAQGWSKRAGVDGRAILAAYRKQ